MTDSATTEATGPIPAPGAEQHVSLDFANSALTLPGGQSLDLLAAPEDAARWLTERQLTPPDTGLREVCAGRLRALREQIRTLIAARIDGRPAPPDALHAINDALTTAPAASLLRWDQARGLHRAPAHPVTQLVDHAMAVLAADAADLLTGPHAERLAACGSAPCTRYLLRTHARRHWCSIRCGDRARAARAYARRAHAETH